jgi:Lon protease-like protein
MSQTLPLFPLGTVLFPGLVLPLHIFEQRYRQLVGDLRDQREPRRFGVIAIREGRETGADGVTSLYDTGCTASVRHISERDDGRFDLATVGTDRFRLISVDRSGPYLRGEVELLDEETGSRDAAQREAEAVQGAFRAYVDALTETGAARLAIPEPPDEPVALSYLVAACIIADLPDRQALLDQPDALARLAAERTWLTRETAMLRSLTSAPAPDLRYRPYSPN